MMASVPSVRPHVVTTTEALRSGISVDQLRSKQVTRITRGVYLRQGRRDDFSVRAEAALTTSGEGAALCAQSALEYCGVELPRAAQDQKIHVLLGRGQRGTRVSWIQAHRPEILPQVSEYKGLPIVVPGDAWMQMARHMTVSDMAVMADGLMRRKSPVMSKSVLGDFVSHWQNRRGYTRAKQAYDLAEAGTDSPQETRVRLLLIKAGLDRPQVNYQVRTPWGPYSWIWHMACKKLLLSTTALFM